MISTLTRYNASFRVTKGLALGPGTQVSILALAQVPAPGGCHDIVATVELRNRIGPFIDGEWWRCSGCDAIPSRELDADAMWHVIENHGDGSCAVPVQEAAADERGGIPVRGWTRTAAHRLLCADCTAAVEAATAAALATRRGAPSRAP